MANTYGLDTSKKYNEVQVRDAIIKCFSLAHKEVLKENFEDIKSSMNEREFESFQQFNIKTHVKSIFEQIGGNFDQPSKSDLLRVCDQLAEFSNNFRSREIVTKHYNEVIELINNL
jgi:hypothetical protein